MRHALLASATLLALALPALAADLAPSPWAAVVQDDLAYIHDTLAVNHPGAVDSLNTGFATWLEEGYAIARGRADTVTTLDEVELVLRGYIAGFADAHAQIGFRYQDRWAVWPGFVVAWRGGEVVVDTVAAGWDGELPPVGAVITACDGVPVDEAVRRDVLRWRDGRIGLQAAWARETPYLFVRGDGDLIPRYRTCTLRMDGEERTLDVSWRQTGRGTLERLLGAAAQRTGGHVALTEMSPGDFWIRIPTFGPQGDDVAAMRAVIDTLPTLRDANLIVFDVRGNGGGNSAWGEQMVLALYGEDFVRWLDSQPGGEPSYALWRVSQANLESIRRDQDTIARTMGTDTSLYGTWQELEARMQAALEAGRTWVRQPGGAPEDADAEAPEPVPDPVTATVVLLTDPYCGSACLDFADIMRALPGVVHAGQETGADTVYMDVTGASLPSGLGSFGVARKVYRNRPRGNNEPYEPTAVYAGDLGDDAAVQAWVRTLIER